MPPRFVRRTSAVVRKEPLLASIRVVTLDEIEPNLASTLKEMYGETEVIASVDKKFAFLCAPKTGSTAVEKAFNPFAEFKVTGHPKWKHINYDQLNDIFGGYFEKQGCRIYVVIRDPVETLVSWYKYRSRDALRDPTHSNSINYTGDISFEQFIEEWGSKTPPSRAKVGLPTNFVLKRNGEIAPIYFFRYESITTLWDTLAEHVGHRPYFERKNVSPDRSVNVSREEILGLSKMRHHMEIFQSIPFIA